jgi:hypothetical protein
MSDGSKVPQISPLQAQQIRDHILKQYGIKVR